MKAPQGDGSPRPPIALRLLLGIVLAKIGLHLVVAALQPEIGYEFHRDELLYLAMAKRISLFGMDSAPGIALVAWIERGLLGESLAAIRFAPALAGAAIAFLAGWMAREMGGGRWAQGVAALAVILPPVYLRTHTLFQPVAFDQLAWTGAATAVAWTAARDDARGWLAAGVALGFGLLFKPTALLWGTALGIAVVATARRRDLATRWFWLGLLVALVGAAPWLVGQLRTGWPFLEQTAVIREAQTAIMDRGAFLVGQLLFHWPSTLLAAVGLAALLVGAAWRRWRILAVAWLTAFAVLFALAGKPYYLSPAYPPLFAAGAAGLEAWTRRVRARPFARAGIVALLVVLSAGIVPLGLPILAPAPMAAYAERLGLSSAVTSNRGEKLRLPQDYADMLGWRDLVERVAGAWDSLPPDERREAVIVAQNYGQAGALDLYGPRRGLPEPVSPVSAFWRWGLHGRRGDTAVTIGVDAGDELDRLYRRAERRGRFRHPWAIESGEPISVLRDPARPLAEVWPELRRP